MLENYKSRLNKIANSNNEMMKYIANELIFRNVQKKEITKAVEFSKEIGVSNALLTKFTKVIGYRTFAEIIFLHNECVKNIIEVEKENRSINKFDKAAEIIDKSRKIFLVGVSSGYIENLEFAKKLNRLDKWTVCSDNKYEQIGGARILTHLDVIVINSVSLQHSWMEKIINETKAKVILVTSNKDLRFPKDNVLKIYYSSGESTSFERTYTIGSRLKVMEILDGIFTSLLSTRPELKALLNLSSYRYVSKKIY